MQVMIGETLLSLIKGHIALESTDALVIPSHWDLRRGIVLDASVHFHAGVKLLEKCREIECCPIGEAILTDGYDLAAKYVIHAAGPSYEGGDSYEDEFLRAAYKNSLQRAVEKQLTSISFSSTSTGGFRYPMRLVATAILNTIVTFLKTEEHCLKLIQVVLPSRGNLKSYKIFSDVLCGLLLSESLAQRIAQSKNAIEKGYSELLN